MLTYGLGVAALAFLVLAPIAALVAVEIRDRRRRRAGGLPVSASTLDPTSELARAYRGENPRGVSVGHRSHPTAPF